MYILVGLGLLFLDLCGLYVLTYFRGKYGWSKEEYEKRAWYLVAGVFFLGILAIVLLNKVGLESLLLGVKGWYFYQPFYICLELNCG
jgi:hypothetical protein